MHPTLNLGLEEPEWLTLLRAERDAGKSVSQIAVETGMARSSVSMLLSGTYPARSLDLVTRRHGADVVRIYRDQVLCPHLRRGISADDCRAYAAAPLSASNIERMRHHEACRRCALNPGREVQGHAL